MLKDIIVANEPKNTPAFMLDGIDENERNDVFYLASTLGDLKTRIEEFQSAVELLDHCDEQHAVIDARMESIWNSPLEQPNKSLKYAEVAEGKSKFSPWAMIGARDAAMTLYDFNKLLDHVIKSLNTLNNFKLLVDEKKLEEIKIGFSKTYFPELKKIRDAVAHRGEVTVEHKKMQLMGPLNLVICIWLKEQREYPSRSLMAVHSR